MGYVECCEDGKVVVLGSGEGFFWGVMVVWVEDVGVSFNGEM